MSDEDLELNTLHRFAKRSPRLVLEEYSHCEVPAGCGGVVLRWRDPRDGRPHALKIATDGEVDVFIDGRPVTGAAGLHPGPHHIALAVSGASALAAVLQPSGPGSQMRSAPPAWSLGMEARVHAAVVPGWEQPGFDAGSWSMPTVSTADHGRGAWRFTQIERLGSLTIEVPGSLWLVDRFEVAP
ncbi:MAG: hypothetical protein H6736_11230 [Alphaproteobacteria bacterium]|nr:hypothetical protein [Alphaproteobacteria bacterium]